MNILFIGESWQGSCARSLREALARRDDVELDDLGEDSWFPTASTQWLHVLAKITTGAYLKQFNAHVMQQVQSLRPDLVMVYKGYAVRTDLLQAIRKIGIPTVNVYPDCSPHAQGRHLREALGHYDLVISTKAYHPARWHDLYGYHNRCEFVPQGYDPALHLVSSPPTTQPFDVVLVTTWRREYGQLMEGFAQALNDPNIKVAIGGNGWGASRAKLPAQWTTLGPVTGRHYVAALRSGKICIAPLTRDVVVNGQRQPGDVDTTRSYELAAAHCFFIHRRTDFMQSLYSEASEVPMFDDAAELAAQVKRYVDDDSARFRMAAAAHARAVPAYSMDARTHEIIELLRRELPTATSRQAK